MTVSSLLELSVQDAVLESLPNDIGHILAEQIRSSSVLDEVAADAQAYADRDPACGHDARNIVLAITSFQAVLHYRVAHWVLGLSDTHSEIVSARDALLFALMITSRGKLLSHSDIHPKAVIGSSFVIDHGIGNVIGETCQIGDSVYCNGGVIFGSSRIFGNQSNKRHPTIGDNVQFGGMVGVYGNITIGSDSFIGARCTVTKDVPPSSKVVLISEQLVTRPYELEA